MSYSISLFSRDTELDQLTSKLHVFTDLTNIDIQIKRAEMRFCLIYGQEKKHCKRKT